MLIDKIVLEVVGITSNLVLSPFNYLLLRGDDDGGSSAPSMVCRHNQQDDLYRFIVAATDDSPDHLMSLYNLSACQPGREDNMETPQQHRGHQAGSVIFLSGEQSNLQ